MKTFSTSQAARRLEIGIKTLSRYIAEKKIPAPEIVNVGGRPVHIWTNQDIERVRQLLPKIANGRKTRYQKKESVVRTQKSGKTTAKTRKKESAVRNQKSGKTTTKTKKK